jgi:hypothetical protein
VVIRTLQQFRERLGLKQEVEVGFPATVVLAAAEGERSSASIARCHSSRVLSFSRAFSLALALPVILAIGGKPAATIRPARHQ